MRTVALTLVLFFALGACAEDRSPRNSRVIGGFGERVEDDDEYFTGGAGGSVIPPFTLEDPGGASLIVSYGQSPILGVCSVLQPPDLFSSCAPINTTPLAGARMACWNSATDTYSGTVPLDLDDSSCRRGLAELPMYGMAEMYVQLSGLPVVFSCNPGQQGTPIAGLSDPSVHFDRLRSCVQAVRDDVTVNFASYGLTSPLTYLRGIKMMQCESDDINKNVNYAAEVGDFMDDVANLVAVELPHQAQATQVVWYQCANTLVTETTLGITQPQLVQAASARSNLHVGGQFGHINQDLCGPAGERCQYETNASVLHYAPWGYRHMGYKLGYELYRAVYRQNAGGMTVSSVIANGTDVQACWDVPVPPIVQDVTTCPAHWNGDGGFAFSNAGGLLFSDEQYVGDPQIVSLSLNPNGTCIDFVLDREPYAGITRFNVSNQGQLRTGQTPANGCRNVAGTVNPGAWWTEYRDSDTQAPPDADAGSMASWMAIESFGISSGRLPPGDTGPGYVTLGDTSEWLEAPDETPDAFGASQRVSFVFWIDTEGSVDGDLLRKGNPNVDGFRLFLDNNPGTGSRIQFQNGGVGNTSTPANNVFDLAEDEVDFRFYAVVVDGSQPLGNRVRHFVGSTSGQVACREIVDVEAGTLPTTFADTSDPLRVGFNAGTSATVALREFAVWTGVAAGEFQLMEMCRRGYVDVRSTTLGTPDYYFRVGCDDSTTVVDGIENLGSQPGQFTGNNMESGDLTLDNPPVCAGGFDAGTGGDAGFPPDAGGGPDPTVPNVASLRFDGVDDYIEITDTDLLDTETDALVCAVVRPLTNRVNDHVVSHWEAGQFQWRWWARNEGVRLYVAPAVSTANSYVGRETPDGYPYVFVSGSHQLLCVRYDLTQAVAADRARLYRNGVEVTLPSLDIGPAGSFTDVTGGTLSVGCTGVGGECWAGDVDELAVWVGASVPTDVQIQNDLSFDADDWNCAVPNWNGGVSGVSAPDLWYRFEQDLTDELGGPTAVIAGGAPAFATDTVACDGQFDVLSSLAPDGVGDSWSTGIVISTESNDNSMVVSVTFDTVVSENGWVVGQWENPGAGENSWGIQQLLDDIRVYVAADANDVGTYVDFTGPVNVQNSGWNNLVVKFDLVQAVQADRVRVWLNGSEMTTKAVTGTIPSTFVQALGSETRLGETLSGALDWGPNVTVSNLVFWRDQDTEPTVAQIQSTFAVDSNAGDPLPEYDQETPVPGCWFVLAGGDLSDRTGNCQDLSPSGGSVWPSVPSAPEPTP